RHLQAAPEFGGGREVIRVRVGIEQVAHVQAIVRGETEVAVQLSDLRIDEHRGAGLLAPHQVRLAAAGRNVFEDHRGDRARYPGQAGGKSTLKLIVPVTNNSPHAGRTADQVSHHGEATVAHRPMPACWWAVVSGAGRLLAGVAEESRAAAVAARPRRAPPDSGARGTVRRRRGAL